MSILALVIDADQSLEEINESLTHIGASLRTCRPDRRPALLEMVDDLLDEKLERESLVLIEVNHGNSQED